MKKLTSLLSYALFLIILLVLTGCDKDSGNYDSFAQCLTDNDVKMYGAYWCSHCNDQKSMFGGSFDKFNYIECSLPERKGQTEICKQAGIKSYPTWEFGDGERNIGKLSINELAERSGCELN